MINNIHGTYTNMMPFLTKPRVSSKFISYSYVKSQKLISSKRGVNSLVIVWNIYKDNKYINTLDTLKEVKYFITTEANR